MSWQRWLSWSLRTKEPSSLTNWKSLCCKYFRLVCPILKSSIAVLMPAFLRRPRFSSIRLYCSIASSSVISRQKFPCMFFCSTIPITELTKDALFNWRAVILAETTKSLSAFFRNWTAASLASVRITVVISSNIPSSWAKATVIGGGTLYPWYCQRRRASAPIIFPWLFTCGWK